jgi:hypothetical protein
VPELDVIISGYKRTPKLTLERVIINICITKRKRKSRTEKKQTRSRMATCTSSTLCDCEYCEKMARNTFDHEKKLQILHREAKANIHNHLTYQNLFLKRTICTVCFRGNPQKKKLIVAVTSTQTCDDNPMMRAHGLACSITASRAGGAIRAALSTHEDTTRRTSSAKACGNEHRRRE